MRFLFWENFQIVNAILRTLLNSQVCQKFKLIENGEFDHLIKILKGVSSNSPLTSKQVKPMREILNKNGSQIMELRFEFKLLC